LTSIGGLADSLYFQADYKNAKTVLKDYLSLIENVSSPNQQQIERRVWLLVEILKESGEFDEASQLKARYLQGQS
jgi:hypothetical protein